jgi:hypothetical protein
MRSNMFKAALIKSGLAASVLLLAAGTASAQSTVNLTAAPQTVTMPDGTIVPMWGLVCGTGTGVAAGGTGTLAPVNNATGAATATVGGGVITGFTVSRAGYGYSSAPTVTITDTTGSGATATATMQVNAIAVTAGGTGYGATTTSVTLSAPQTAGGIQATATATISSTGVITAIAVNVAGTGYTSAPTVTITDTSATGTGAAATATLSVNAVTVTAGGSLYSATPTVAVSGGGGPGALAAAGCTQTNGIAQSAGTPANLATNTPGSISTIWQPPLITVPVNTAGATSLTINLTNSLSFTPTGATTANTVPTSLTIVGQIGGGLGTPATVASPTHSGQNLVTWSTQTAANFTPPVQGARVQSFGTEVAATGATLTATQVASGSALTWTNLQPGTYLIESGTHPSIQGPMGLYGVLVVTSAPSSTTSGTTTTYTTGTAYPAAGTTPAVTYGAEVPLLFSEIDPVQNAAVNTAVNTAGFAETKVWSGMPGGCGNAASPVGVINTCYPPAVNYLPVYWMINGVGFNKTNAAASLFAASPGTLAAPITTGTVLVRLVNAGLKMHVPSIVNSLTSGFSGAGVPATVVGGFTLIAEDGNPVPGAAHVQSEVFMAAGKTYDVMINLPLSGSSPLAVYDRELSLSGNQIDRDAGMLAYIGVNGALLPTGASAGAFSAAATGAQANPDTYNSVVAGRTLTVSDPSKGVIANDVNVYGVKISGTPCTSPGVGCVTATTMGGAAATTMTSANGTLSLMANGTFTYTPTAAAGSTPATDTFTYCANGTTTICTQVTLGACGSGTPATCTLEASTGITCTNTSYTAASATYLAVKPPGVLSGCKDSAGYPLTAVLFSGTGVIGDANGGFTASSSLPGTTSFTFQAKNSQGTLSAPATVNVIFPAGSGLAVTVLDAQTKAPITDYRWIIEEDRTFYVDPKCTSNPPPAGCPTTTIPGLGVTGIVPSLGLNFHTSYMPYVAQGCTGPKSCEFGQMVVDAAPLCTAPGVPAGCSQTGGQHVNAVCDVGNGVCRPDPGTGTTSGGSTWVDPSQVVLDPSKRYYISVFPGDAADPFAAGYGGVPCSAPGAPANCVTGHSMGGAPIPAAACGPNATGTFVCTWPATGATCTPAPGQSVCVPANSTNTKAYGVTALVQPAPYPTADLSVFVFEDDFPLNGEQDGGGGTGGVNTNNEPGLGQFQIHMWDAMGGNGDFTGQMGFDMFNQPLVNSLAGTVDPLNGNDACPISANPRQGTLTCTAAGQAGSIPVAACTAAGQTVPDPTQTGITGFIVTCPEFESDGKTPSPLAGQAVVKNLMPGRWGVIATPGADRIARGEEWLQTNTLDGQKAHDSFTRIGEPGYFQEYGPAGFHVSIGFANPAIINARKPAVCAGTDVTGLNAGGGGCLNTLKGRVVGERLSRTPDERLYGSGSHDAFAWTQCYVSFGDPDGEDFAFTKCDADGKWTLTGLPDGDWRITTFDQWNDALVDGLSTPVRLGAATCPGRVCDVGDIATTQWEANLYTKTFIDDNRDGIAQSNETGIPFANVAVRLRDGSLENLLTTDFTGTANFNETFPLFSWYVVETDVTRYKNTGTHVVYDVGGPADGSPSCGVTGYPPCGTSMIGKFLANTAETISVPTTLRVPGAIYCTGADCSGKSMNPAATGSGTNASDPPSVCTTATTSPFATTCSTTLSSGRIDPPWVGVEGWQGFPGQNSFIEFGKAPYWENPVAGGLNENGGIKGHVVYASTRPFDDPQMLVQTQWTSLIPHVTINLYQEGFALDGVTPTLTLVDTTQTSSFDEWAQGFRSDGVPYMNCPGQGSGTVGSVTPDLFFFSLYDQPQYLDFYSSQHGGPAMTALPNNSQFKCYDGMHNWNQIQPAPYDGAYQFPSVNSRDTTRGAPAAVSTTISAISEAGSTVTVATATTHGLISGALVTIAGAPGYNSTDAANGGSSTSPKLFAITVTGPKSFTYSIPNSATLAPGTAGTVSALATNCTICIADPVPASGSPDADPFRSGLAMLPKGKYVVEVVLPQGYELVKEEDKNILIGDQFIAPVTQQFGGLGTVFIMPDQASVATAYTTPGVGYNANTGANGNGMNATQSFGANPNNGIVPAFVPEPTWPCVGEARIVPDYISLFPQSKQMAPFAGATRRLCDRKEVTLSDQMGAIAKFWLYTSTHVASKFTGGITDDYTSEFDPFSPQFGEKFAPPDLPVAVKDWTGNEVSRVYADHWGAYDGMTYSTWEVNPPNPTGYAPTMMVFCMNDPGPVLDTRQTVLNPAGLPVLNPTLGQMITDPSYTPGYSQFCYELPFMPGTTQYLDTPVVPTSAFAGAGYNNPDCAYPDATPAVKEVDSSDGIGPWVSAAGTGHTLTITALGDQMVPNHAYSGPSATAAPYNQKLIRRHYGFGTQATTVAGGTGGSVTIGGVAATVNSWSDSQIQVTVPTGVPACAVQQQAIYSQTTSTAQCGELVITNATTQAGGQVTGVSVTPPPATNRGGTYSGNPLVAPTVSFSGGGGTGAAATAHLGPATGSVASVAVTAGGSGYTANFQVTFSGGGGTGAHGTATVRKRVTAVTITNAGSYACSAAAPTVSFSNAGGGGGAQTATGTVQLSACTTPTARRTVTGVTITNPTTNNYAIGATINVTFSPAGTGGTRALGNTTVAGDTTGFVSSVSMTGGANSGGSGYSTAPTPVFTAGSGTGAMGTSTLSASRSATVVSVTVTSGGFGYTSAPTVTFSGSTATRARGTATINGPVATFAGKRSIDTVTVTIGGKAPTHVAASATIQSAIDAAKPGDLIIIDPTCNPTAAAGSPAGAPVACSSALLGGTAATQTASQAAHNELLIMWKPVRLQGVGAASSVINATTHPSGQLKLDAWRQKIDCLFGLGLNGSPVVNAPGTPTNNPYDSTGAVTCGSTNGQAWFGYNATLPSTPQVDRLPLEATVGWDANLNGNLAEQLQEPSLMGALEGAGITVLGKGVDFHGQNPFDPTLLAGFPTGTTLLQDTLSNPAGAECLDSTGTVNPFPSNYSCNPSSIDGVTITQGSQGGGGIFVHGWGHNLQIGNNRIYSNAGTLSGGINVGQGEYPPSYVQGSATNAAPGSCEESPVAGAVLPYCHNVNVNIQNNYIALNSSTGDELFSATPAGAGGVSICTGSDYYKFNYNWVCGNLSSGDGGGLGHLGFSYNGDIEHNSIVFNQSINPTIPANGGGMVIMGTPDADVICANNVNVDTDCSAVGFAIQSVTVTSGGTGYAATDTVNFVGGGGLGATGTITVAGGAITAINVTNGGAGYSAPVAATINSSTGSGVNAVVNLGTTTTVQSGIGPSDGVGPGLVINANLIMGNAAESGTGGGIAFQAVNGGDMVAFPDDAGQWNSVNLTNNIIVDNVAGWDGAGLSLLDSPNVNIINNTIAFNNSTASSGMLFNTLGAPIASTQGPTCTSNCGTTTNPQVAGVVALQHSAVLSTNLAATPVVCPAGHFTPGGTNAATNGACRSISYPMLANNIIYHNSSYQIGVGALSNQFQQNVVTLYNATFSGSGTGTAAGNQTTTGQCVTGASYWDIGVRGDTGPNNHGSGFTLNPTASVLSSGSGYAGGNNTFSGNPSFTRFYCDGARTPPEFGASGWAVPPGISDATVPNPAFNLTPVATVDEGNNWVNLRWGPLSMTNPTVLDGPNANYGGSVPLGDYTITSGSAAQGRVTGANFTAAPQYDFFDRPRKTGGGGGGSTDAGAVKLSGTTGSQFTLSPVAADFGFVPHNSPTTLDQDIIVTNTDVVPVTGLNATISCAGVTTGCNLASFSMATDLPLPTPPNAVINGCAIGQTLGAGESCVLNVIFNPTSSSQAARNASLVVTASGISQTVALTGHDSIATIAVSPATGTAGTPAMSATPANTVAVTGTITVTNTSTRCDAATTAGCSAAGIPAGYPPMSVDAGPYIPTAITLTPLTGTGTWAVGGTCAVGTAINPGLAAVPASATTPASAYVPSGTCTVTATYTPPTTCATTTTTCAGTANVTVTGYGTASAAPIINRTINAN